MQEQSGSRLLVTGANGFVGRAICIAAKNSGWQVRALTRRAPSLPGDVEHVVVEDWRDERALSAALQGCQAVIHCAARAHIMVDPSQEPLADYRAVNVEMTLAMARQSARAGIKRFVFISSVKVNGERTLPGKPFNETDIPSPVDAYGISKWEAEEGLALVAKQTGLEMVIIRPPLVYGPGVKANFATMLRWIKRGLPLPLGAIADNRRSFIGIDNLADFAITSLVHPAAANETFLVSDGEDLSTADLLKRLGHAIGRPAKLFALPVVMLKAGALLIGRPAMAQRLCDSLQIDSAKAQSKLDWHPVVSVDVGLQRLASR